MCVGDQQAPLWSGCDTDTDTWSERHIQLQPCERGYQFHESAGELWKFAPGYSLPEFSAVHRAGRRSPAHLACTRRRAESPHGPDSSPSGWPHHPSPGSENKRKCKEISASARSTEAQLPINHVLRALINTLPGGNAVYPNGSTTESNRNAEVLHTCLVHINEKTLSTFYCEKWGTVGFSAEQKAAPAGITTTSSVSSVSWREQVFQSHSWKL